VVQRISNCEKLTLHIVKTTHKIIFGDARNMDLIDDESIDLIVTSPPYWQLKDYGDKRQIGYYDSYEYYINNLNIVWQEAFRVLKSGCRMCINIGDQFARSVYYGRYKVIPIRTEIIKFCEILGLDYMGAIIWQKVTTTNTSGGAVIMGSYPFPRNGILKLDYEFILLFKKKGKSRRASNERKEMSRLSPDEWNTFFSGHWKFPGEKQSRHLASFPIELPNRLIRMFSFVGDTILDPFLGSGTTSVSAKSLNRNSIGIEINGEFLPIIKSKLRKFEPQQPKDSELVLEYQQDEGINFEAQVAKLPYLFKDPHKLEIKENSSKKSYGSIVKSTDRYGKKYYTIKKILGPNHVLLNDNLNVILMGIKIKGGKEKEAIDFLMKKTQSQKLIVKFEDNVTINDDTLFAYLFLQNRTFLNAQMIKRGLADVETERKVK